MKNGMQELLCCLGCQYCIDSGTCNMFECDCDDCECEEEKDEKEGCSNCDKKCCGGSKNAATKGKYLPGRCRHCGGKDDYAYVSIIDGMICCFFCKSQGRT